VAEGDALREVFAEFGIEFDDAQLQQGSRSVGGMVARVRELGAMLAGNAIVGAIRDFANSFEEQAGALQDSASALGITTAQLQELRFAATAAGLSTQAADASLLRLQQSAAGAASGSKAQADAFRALGVDVRDASGRVRDLSELSDDVAAGLGRIEDPSRRAQVAVDLFGRSGARLATVMHEGEGGLAALRAELGLLGGGMSSEAIDAANAYGDATDRLTVAQDALRSVLATALLPLLTTFVKKLTEVEAWLVKTARGTHVVELALVALGGAATVQAAKMLRAWAPVLLPFAKLALAIGAVVLVVDDLITLVNGGDSAIGRFLDSMAGVGTSQRFAQELRDAFEGLQLFLTDLAGDVRVLRDSFSEWLTSARADVTGFRNDFAGAWEFIRSKFDETFEPIIARVEALFARVDSFMGSGTLARLSDRVSNIFGGGAAPTAATPAAPRAEGFFEGVAAEWRDVFNGANASLATAGPGGQTVAAPRAATTAAATRTTNVTTNAPITITGVSDPREAAREATRQLRDRERAAHDAAHPVREED
jgi:hypothetical protein